MVSVLVLGAITVLSVVMLRVLARFLRQPKPLQAVQPARQIESLPQTMGASEVEGYTPDFSRVNHNPTRALPALLGPKDVMVKVHASSINPIDLAISRSYGRVLLNEVRRRSGFPADGKELPLVLGRDCSGAVVATGQDVTKFEVGTEVWATPALYRQGCHAEFAVMGEGEIALKPKNLTHTEATAIPYVAMTSWKALVDNAGLNANTTPGKRILITGGSGGIGTFSIQMLKAWGGHVTTTCSSGAVKLVEGLGADLALDYSRENLDETLKSEPKFDVVYDTVGNETSKSYINLLKERQNSTYVTIRTPLLSGLDKHGFYVGILVGGATWAKSALSQYLSHGRRYRWAIVSPNSDALQTVTEMVEDGKIKPVIQQTFPLVESKAAYQKLAEGHSRGKVIIEVIKAGKKSDCAIYTEKDS